MRWHVAIAAIASCKATSIGFARKRRSVCALHWTCGVKPKPKGVNKPLHHFIVHGLDKPGCSATVSRKTAFNIDNSANPLKRKATGSDNRAFLYFYGTALPRVERQNWR